ncbi:MAG TPA: hypothetical protein VMH28_05220 [Candidatus Acidoferrales bacterium]|nr:hypothetical protein [Candidatus Acidoferrales bacterium]
MFTGIQFTGTLAAGATQRWFTYNWNPAWHVVWYMMPTSVNTGAPELDWTIEVQLADASHVTYWLTVTNLTNTAINFEGRYAVLAQ